jgi:transposase
MMRQIGSGDWIGHDEKGIDLRRKRSADLARRMTRRAEWLEPGEREITLAFFDRGLNAAQIGMMIREEPRIVRKRLRQIISRLEDPRCAYVVAHRNAWTARRRAIAEDLFIRGRSMREISKERGLSLHAVRKHRDAIDAMTIAQTLTDRPSRTWQHAERG